MMMMTERDWTMFTRLPAWTPLAALPYPATHLGEILFRIGPGCYLTCVSYDRQLREIEGGTFVTAVVWAQSDGAARRAMLMDIEADELRDSDPPGALLLPGSGPTHGDILAAAQTGRHGRHSAWIDYRIGRDGAFIHRTIAVHPAYFHFRSLEGDDDPCYAIHYRLAP